MFCAEALKVQSFNQDCKYLNVKPNKASHLLDLDATNAFSEYINSFQYLQLTKYQMFMILLLFKVKKSCFFISTSAFFLNIQ